MAVNAARTESREIHRAARMAAKRVPANAWRLKEVVGLIWRRKMHLHPLETRVPETENRRYWLGRNGALYVNQTIGIRNLPPYDRAFCFDDPEGLLESLNRIGR